MKEIKVQPHEKVLHLQGQKPKNKNLKTADSQDCQKYMKKEIAHWQNWHNYFSSLTISGKFDEILRPRNFGKFPRKKTLAHGYLQMCNRNSARLIPVKGVWSIREQHQKTTQKPTPVAIQCEVQRLKHRERYRSHLREKEALSLK